MYVDYMDQKVTLMEFPLECNSQHFTKYFKKCLENLFVHSLDQFCMLPSALSPEVGWS